MEIIPCAPRELTNQREWSAVWKLKGRVSHTKQIWQTPACQLKARVWNHFASGHLWSNSSEVVSLIVWTGTSVRTEPSPANSEGHAALLSSFDYFSVCGRREKNMNFRDTEFLQFHRAFCSLFFPTFLQNASNRGLLVTVVLSAELNGKVTEQNRSF